MRGIQLAMEAIGPLESFARCRSQGPWLAAGYQLLEPDFSDLYAQRAVVVYVAQVAGTKACAV